MIASYLASALRALRARPGLATIQISGLAVGLACCLLVGLYLRTESLADSHHAHADRTYRVLQTFSTGDGAQAQAMTSGLLAPTLLSSLPGVERAVRIRPDDAVVEVGESPRREDVLYADASVFDVLGFPLASGNAAEALTRPDHIVLSPEAARRFFGTPDAVGQSLRIRIRETPHTLTVAGVLAPVPITSSLRPEVLLPYVLYASERESRWGSLSPRTYVRLAPGVAPDDVTARLPALLASTEAPEQDLSLQPLREIHWTPEVGATLARTSDPVFPLVLGGIALFVLLVACINFTTLALASGARRAREVGVRKSLGAEPRQLALQFCGEAVVTAAIATGAGLLLAAAALPMFRSLVGLDLRLGSDPLLVGALVSLPLGVGLLAGSYPALVLSRLRATDVLKGETGVGRPGALTRGLAALQFAAAAALVLATLIMAQQLRHVQNQPLGIDAENLVRIESNYGSTYEGARILRALRAELANEPSVAGLTGSTTMLFDEDTPHLLPVVSNADTVQSAVLTVTPEYASTLGLEIVQGRDLESGSSADSLRAVLVNEAFVRASGWRDVVDRRASSAFSFDDARIVGVVRDHPIAPLYQTVPPAAYTVGPDPPAWDIYARASPGRSGEAVAALRSAWAAVAPGVPFEATAVLDDARAPYAADARTARLVFLAALFAIGIACLGLFALARLEGVRRTREVGIRRALGASAASVTALLTRQFALVVAGAFVVAVPLTTLAMRRWERWLETYATRIEVGAGTVQRSRPC